MERETFDRLTRLIGAAGTRRAALRLVATAALLGGAASVEDVAAKRRKNRGRVRAQQEQQIPEVCEFLPQNGCSQPAEPNRCLGKNFRPGANLTKCNFFNTSGFLANVRLNAANLTSTCWFDMDLFGPPSFRSANLTNACFFEASLVFADFRGANLQGASFCEADLRGANFQGSNLTDEQLACAADIGCDTILPNGKPAVQCDADQVCCGAVCCDPANCEQDTCVDPPAP